MEHLADQLRKELGYDPDAESGVDDLIGYKDALEDLTYHIDVVLRRNAEGEISAADVCGTLWDMGFDPNPDGTPVPEAVR